MMKRRRRNAGKDTLVATMDLMAEGLLRTSKQDSDSVGGKAITLGERLRIFGAVTDWIVAKSRLEDPDERSGIDALKARLRGSRSNDQAEGNADRGAGGAGGASSRAGRIARFERDRSKGGPDLDRLKRKLPDHDNRVFNRIRRNNGDPRPVVVGSDGGVDPGLPDDLGPDSDEADDQHRL